MSAAIDVTARFRRLLDEAKRQTLFVSPPYSDARCESAFLSGYEYALRDIAQGRLDGAAIHRSDNAS